MGSPGWSSTGNYVAPTNATDGATSVGVALHTSALVSGSPLNRGRGWSGASRGRGERPPTQRALPWIVAGVPTLAPSVGRIG